VPQPSFETPAQHQPAETTAAADHSDSGGGLGDNLSVQAARADWLYHSRQYQVSRNISPQILQDTPAWIQSCLTLAAPWWCLSHALRL